jgi:probable F420-dependent oxidoreductase
VVSFGPLAEDLGYDSVWVMDHLFNNGYIRERLDDKPYYHPMATLSHISALTSTVKLGTSVMVLPYHNPVELAKYAATLDRMSGGRVILGIGVGAMTPEFEALGIPLNQRGSLTNESIDVMRELWSNEDPSYNSERWDFQDLKFAPKPLQTVAGSPHVPLWVGGSSPGALRRAARRGDGWHPSGVSAEDFAIGRQRVRELAEAAGRNPDDLVMSARVEVEAHGGPSSQRAADRSRLPGDDPSAMIAGIAAYRDAGVQHIVLALNTGDVERLRTLMRVISEEVVPQFR